LSSCACDAMAAAAGEEGGGAIGARRAWDRRRADGRGWVATRSALTGRERWLAGPLDFFELGRRGQQSTLPSRPRPIGFYYRTPRQLLTQPRLILRWAGLGPKERAGSGLALGSLADPKRFFFSECGMCLSCKHRSANR
jgi:hypothetical protein